MNGRERKVVQRLKARIQGKCSICCSRPKTEGMKTCAICRQRVWEKRHAA